MRFNPPPNWPAPAPGWQPPAGWQPDPSWGPPPPGWNLWVDDLGRPAAAPKQGMGTGAKVGLAVVGGLVGLCALFGIIGALSGGGDDTEPTARTTSSSEAPASSSAPPAETSSAPPAETTTAPPPPPAEPAIVVTSRQMIDELEANALAAKTKYEGKQVTVTGVVGNIDASGDYFALDPEPDAFILTGVQIQTGEEFLAQVLTFTQGQTVTVTGEVTLVGEILGYGIEAETITTS